MLQNFEILSECKTNKNLVSQKLIDIKNIFSKKAIAKKNIDALISARASYLAISASVLDIVIYFLLIKTLFKSLMLPV